MSDQLKNQVAHSNRTMVQVVEKVGRWQSSFAKEMVILRQTRRLLVGRLIDKSQGSRIERLAFDQSQFINCSPFRE
jgi:hypothetical protein